MRLSPCCAKGEGEARFAGSELKQNFVTKVSESTLAALIVGCFFTFATVASAASIGALVDDKLAVERVYYAKQKDAKQPFEQAVPRSAIEKRVQQEVLKERVLQRAYGVSVSAEQVQAEVERIRRSSLNPQMLREIQEALANSPARFADAEALAQGVLALMADDALRLRLAQAASTSIQHFTWSRACQAMERTLSA